MNQQTPTQEPMPSEINAWQGQSRKAIIITVIITFLVPAGGVYAWQQAMNNIEQEQNEESIQQLQQQVTVLQNQVNQMKVESEENILVKDENEKNILEGWLEYTNKTAGFSFSYPDWINLNNQSPEKDLSLSITTADLSNYEDGPLGLNLERALKDEAALAKGEFGEGVLWSHADPYKTVVKLDDSIYGKKFSVLGMLEVGDVQFVRYLIFYNNNQEVIISFSVPRDDKESYERIFTAMPQYFKTDTEYGTIWDDMQGFLSALENKQGSEFTQLWYNTFDQIIDTIEVQK